MSKICRSEPPKILYHTRAELIFWFREPNILLMNHATREPQDITLTLEQVFGFGIQTFTDPIMIKLFLSLLILSVLILVYFLLGSVQLIIV